MDSKIGLILNNDEIFQIDNLALLVIKYYSLIEYPLTFMYDTILLLACSSAVLQSSQAEQRMHIAVVILVTRFVIFSLINISP